MAEKKTIIINGNPVEAWQFSHSAQEIDDAVDAAVTQEERDAWNCKLDKTGGTVTGVTEFKSEVHITNPVIMTPPETPDGIYLSLYKDSKSVDWVMEILGTEGDEPTRISGVATPKNDLDAANKKYVDDKIASIAGGAPAGCIVLWSGAASNIPDGWYLCDGQHGTPDLRDRFVIGAGNAYTPGATGGNAQVTLTREQIPAHTHTYSKTSGSTSSYGMSNGGTSVIKSVSSTSTDSGSAGSGSPVDILPPYYALSYIMKIS